MGMGPLPLTPEAALSARPPESLPEDEVLRDKEVMYAPVFGSLAAPGPTLSLALRPRCHRLCPPLAPLKAKREF